jgi:hypothetical protein
MSEPSDSEKVQPQPHNLEKREALKKLGRFAAYTAPATLVALGYFAGSGAAAPISSVSPPPPPLSPPPPPPP